MPTEQAALSQKYLAATREAGKQGHGDQLTQFESAVADQSFAVICRDMSEVQRLARSDSEVYLNYYKMLDAGLRIPNTSDEWNLKREQADSALFLGFQRKMHHAVLTLDYGMSYYGECHLQLNSQFIAGRSTVFWDNSAEFYATHAKPGERPFSGFRAVWQDRGKLAAAKLGGKIHAKVTAERFAGILRQDGKKPGEEKFIEVHVFGDLTIRSTQMVMVKKSRRPLPLFGIERIAGQDGRSAQGVGSMTPFAYINGVAGVAAYQKAAQWQVLRIGQSAAGQPCEQKSAGVSAG